MEITADDITAGLRELGIGADSVLVVHASLRSFGRVVGGASAVVEGLLATGATITMMAASDGPAIPAPPGLVRPNNNFWNAADWQSFEAHLAQATPYRHDLPVAHSLGAVCEALRAHPASVRGPHPLYGFVAAGPRAHELVAAETTSRMMGAIEAAEALGGHVLLLGVDHTSNTTIHLAEQRLGRGRFFRYAVGADGLWLELPNISGESHAFDEIEPRLRDRTRETRIGGCRVRLVAIADVLAAATTMIREDPRAMLCRDDENCRCHGAWRQLVEGVPGPLV